MVNKCIEPFLLGFFEASVQASPMVALEIGSSPDDAFNAASSSADHSAMEIDETENPDCDCDC